MTMLTLQLEERLNTLAQVSRKSYRNTKKKKNINHDSKAQS